jgi:hypothetical protein
MDFVCPGCGKYSYILPEKPAIREAIENLIDVMQSFDDNPWLLPMMEEYHPELMDRFYALIADMVKT